LKPPRYLSVPCNECGHPKRVINGHWLRELREKAGMTQRQFGELVKLSSPYLSDIERNRRACPEEIQKAYETLGVG
jgi:transcriptional regulator with XRE-family HTH domain